MMKRNQHTDDIRAASLEAWAGHDEEIHMPPSIPGRSLPPRKADKVERVSVELVGGPLHGETVQVRKDRSRIELPYAPPEEEAETKYETRPAPLSVSGVLLVYTRETPESTVATFDSLELDNG